MDLRDSRFLVAGATGALGSRLSRSLIDEGARAFLAGRDDERLAELAGELGAPSATLDLGRPDAAVAATVEALGGRLPRGHRRPLRSRRRVPDRRHKAALSTYLTAVRRERRRRGLTVLDVRPPHLDTDFSSRALHGEPPKLPEPADADALVAAILDALRSDRRELRYDPTNARLVAN